ncbi:FRIGIDA-like protein 4a [Chenopodium quinoa]|uniref:FRIGIDA-like protein 4a n=1 Tax=Chenopodium quinoa TaxID=63459 RepID=UPI000B793AC3|nr:FRIGIDA-like protein 4a [Chenopodium quinoa]
MGQFPQNIVFNIFPSHNLSDCHLLFSTEFLPLSLLLPPSMAATTTANKVHNIFENLETQKAILCKCTDLYKALTSHFTNLQQSIDSKTLTLEANLQNLDSTHQKSLEELYERETSIPERLISLSSEIESKKQSAIAEVEKALDESAPLSEVLRSLCRRMDHSNLLRFVVGKRKETASLRWEMREALKECVDPERMVLEAVKEFLAAKEAGMRGMADKRWACGVVVTGLFPAEELKKKKKKKKKKKSVGVDFARKTVEEAEEVVRGWREKTEQVGDGEGGMGSAEAAMFLQVVVGFGLKEIFEEEFYRNMVVEFAARRDMAKLALPIFGDQIADLIDQLVKNEKEVEAVYFVSESGLIEKYQPVSLLKSSLRHVKKKTTEILKKGNHNAGATDEANTFEMNYTRSIIRCVEDHKLEAEFSVNSLKKRLSLLEKAKSDKKKSSASNSSKPSNKRAHSSGGPPRSRGAPPPRPAKMQKFPSPHPTYGQRDAVSRSPALSPVSRYLGHYSLSGQTAYDPGLTASTYGASLPNQTAYDPALTASTYGQRYDASLAPTADQVAQQQYGVAGGSAPSPSVGPRFVGSYGLQSAYGTYDYGATPTSTYQPPYGK